MLDLSVKNKVTMDIALDSGEIIKILPPKRKLFAELVNAENVTGIDEMYSLVCIILSNNLENKVFAQSDIESFDLSDIKNIIESYTAFVVQIQKN